MKESGDPRRTFLSDEALDIIAKTNAARPRTWRRRSTATALSSNLAGVLTTPGRLQPILEIGQAISELLAQEQRGRSAGRRAQASRLHGSGWQGAGDAVQEHYAGARRRHDGEPARPSDEEALSGKAIPTEAQVDAVLLTAAAVSVRPQATVSADSALSALKGLDTASLIAVKPLGRATRAPRRSRSSGGRPRPYGGQVSRARLSRSILAGPRAEDRRARRAARPGTTARSRC